MTATATARNRLAALVLATAALGGGAAVAAAQHHAAPATHAVAMYKEDPDGCRPTVSDGAVHVSVGSTAPGGYVCP